MQVYNANETARLLPYAALAKALREGISKQVTVPQRTHHAIPVPDGTCRTLISMPAWDDEGVLGIKLVNVSPGNTRKGLPAIAAIHIVFEPDAGTPCVVLDGAELTARRTAMIAALGGHALAPRSSSTHLIVGAGAVAAHLPGSYRTLREFDRTMIWARRSEQSAALVRNLREQGCNVEAVSDLASAAYEADVISCATMAREPILKGAWLKPGAHVDLIGAYLPDMREADDDVLVGAEIWADALPGALTDSGELADPISRGIIEPSDVLGDLKALLAQHARSEDPPRRTVFKSVGNAQWDFLCTRHLINTS